MSRMKVIMHFDETELIKCNALTKEILDIIRYFFMQFLKETARKRVREKDNEKMPEKKCRKTGISSGKTGILTGKTGKTSNTFNKPTV